MRRISLIIAVSTVILFGTLAAAHSGAGQTATPPASVATPITHGPTTLVTGTIEGFSLSIGTPTVNADGSVSYRNGRASYRLISNDPRVTGSVTGTWQADTWGSADNGSLVQWGTDVLTNNGGTWEGTFTGIYTSETADMISWWFVGTGAYDGLTFYLLMTDLEGEWTGLIFPGTPPLGASPVAE